MTHDIDLWIQHMHVPHFMSTCDGKLVLETERDARIGLTDYHMALRKLDVVRMDRTCDTARRVNEETIVGFHTTAMHSGDGTAYPGYPVRWVLHRTDDVWRVAKSDSALSASDWDGIPHNTLTQFDHVGGDVTKARRLLAQTIVDRIDAVYMADDFDGWRDSVHLPLTFETRNGTDTFTNEADLQRDFDLYQKEFRIHRISELTRVVTGVEEIDSTTLRVNYRVHVLSGTRYVVQPWDGAMIFKKVDERWLLQKLVYALGHLNWNSNAGRTSHDVRPD